MSPLRNGLYVDRIAEGPRRPRSTGEPVKLKKERKGIRIEVRCALA